jgi:hypothetical protein
LLHRRAAVVEHGRSWLLLLGLDAEEVAHSRGRRRVGRDRFRHRFRQGRNTVLASQLQHLDEASRSIDFTTAMPHRGEQRSPARRHCVEPLLHGHGTLESAVLSLEQRKIVLEGEHHPAVTIAPRVPRDLSMRAGQHDNHLGEGLHRDLVAGE